MKKKKVAIVVGHQNSGKSTTINKHLKPLLKIKKGAYLFCKKRGYIISQSFEEGTSRSPDKTLQKHKNKLYFVFAMRPQTENKSKLDKATTVFKHSGYEVKHFNVSKSKRNDLEQNKIAQEIIDFLQLECN